MVFIPRVSLKFHISVHDPFFNHQQNIIIIKIIIIATENTNTNPNQHICTWLQRDVNVEIAMRKVSLEDPLDHLQTTLATTLFT